MHLIMSSGLHVQCFFHGYMSSVTAGTHPATVMTLVKCFLCAAGAQGNVRNSRGPSREWKN